MSAHLCVMIIYLVLPSPTDSSDLPKGTTGSRIAFILVLLRMGFTWLELLPAQRWSLTPPFHPYRTSHKRSPKNTFNVFFVKAANALTAVYLCCTFLRVASTRRYLASCPVKLGLSSPAAFRHLQPRSSALLETHLL